ncbi:MAG: OmpA family protein [Thermocrinis sp.]|jgi:peptidoglycan-associated lipoprotein|uniref:OmpA family protein n=1 Tax=Thermocrinis sp. TaxID=2024383 RepID=UPI003C12A2BA
MKKSLLALSLLGGAVFAQDKPLDPCGSPKEVFSKHLLDQCYKGYFEAIMEAKKNAEEALRLAREANNKIRNLEERISALEETLEDSALMEAKRNAEEALSLATEANNKISELEERISALEETLEDSALMEAKRNAEEALSLATEANNKISDLEKRTSSLEKTADDHERRIRALEARKPEAPRPKTEGVGPYKWQLEEVGVVYFDFNKFDIKKSEAKKLDEIVNKIKESGREVLVVGFADKRGPSSYNFNLSMWRAQMTASYLAKKGVDIGKIRVAAYGKEVADLLGKDFRAQRVVKIFLVY